MLDTSAEKKALLNGYLERLRVGGNTWAIDDDELDVEHIAAIIRERLRFNAEVAAMRDFYRNGDGEWLTILRLFRDHYYLVAMAKGDLIEAYTPLLVQQLLFAF